MATRGKYYYIQSRLNGLVLDVEDQSEDPGTQVIIWEKKDNQPDNQLWYDDHETGTIRNKQNGFCLTLKDGDIVVDEYEDDNPDQKWVFRRGKGIIQNREDREKVLDIWKAESEPGTKVVAWEEHGEENQLWECDRVRCRHFLIRSRMSGLVMDIWKKSTDEGAKVVMWEETGDENQLWWEDDCNNIRSKLTGFAIQGEDDDDGEEIRCYPYEEDNESQQWVRTPWGSIVNRHRPDKALDIWKGSDKKGAKIVVWDRHGEVNQQFDFELVD